MKIIEFKTTQEVQEEVMTNWEKQALLKRNALKFNNSLMSKVFFRTLVEFLKDNIFALSSDSKGKLVTLQTIAERRLSEEGIVYFHFTRDGMNNIDALDLLIDVVEEICDNTLVSLNLEEKWEEKNFHIGEVLELGEEILEVLLMRREKEKKKSDVMPGVTFSIIDFFENYLENVSLGLVREVKVLLPILKEKANQGKVCFNNDEDGFDVDDFLEIVTFAVESVIENKPSSKEEAEIIFDLLEQTKTNLKLKRAVI